MDFGFGTDESVVQAYLAGRLENDVSGGVGRVVNFVIEGGPNQEPPFILVDESEVDDFLGSALLGDGEHVPTALAGSCD
jgi:hypothetical protein